MGKVKERTNETIQVRMPTIMAAQAFDEAIEAVKNEPNLRAVLVNKDDSEGAAITNGMALELLISWANEMFDAQGFGTGEHKFSNQFYGLIDAQMKNVMKNIKNALVNCDSGIKSIKHDCDERILDLEAFLKSEKETANKKIMGLEDQISILDEKRIDLEETCSSLAKENSALIDLKEANLKTTDALEKERNYLNERIVKLQRVSEENAELLKHQQDYEAKISDLSRQIAELVHNHELQVSDLSRKITNLVHNHEIQVKEKELEFEKKLSAETNKAAAAASEDLYTKLNPVIAELKEQIRSERAEAQKQIKEARNDERSKAAEEIARLQEIIRREQAFSMSATREADKAEPDVSQENEG